MAVDWVAYHRDIAERLKNRQRRQLIEFGAPGIPPGAGAVREPREPEEALSQADIAAVFGGAPITAKPPPSAETNIIKEKQDEIDNIISGMKKEPPPSAPWNLPWAGGKKVPLQEIAESPKTAEILESAGEVLSTVFAPLRYAGTFSPGGVRKEETPAGRELALMNEAAMKAMIPPWGTPEREAWNKRKIELEREAIQQAPAIYEELPLWRQMLAETPWAMVPLYKIAEAVGLPARVARGVYIAETMGLGPLVDKFGSYMGRVLPAGRRKLTGSEIKAAEKAWNKYLSETTDKLAVERIEREAAKADFEVFERAARTIPEPAAGVKEVIPPEAVPTARIAAPAQTNWQKAISEASAAIGEIEAEWVAKKHVGVTREQLGRIDAVIENIAAKHNVPGGLLRKQVLWEVRQLKWPQAREVGPLTDKQIDDLISGLRPAPEAAKPVAETISPPGPVVKSEAAKGLTPKVAEPPAAGIIPAPAMEKEPWQMTREELLTYRFKNPISGSRSPADVPKLREELEIASTLDNISLHEILESEYNRLANSFRKNLPIIVYRADETGRGIIPGAYVTEKRAYALEHWKANISSFSAGKPIIYKAKVEPGDLITFRDPHEFIFAPEDISEWHKLAVRKALKEGKSVPPEVLKDYPDLAAKMPGRATPEAAKLAQLIGLPVSSIPAAADQATEYREGGVSPLWGLPAAVAGLITASALRRPAVAGRAVARIFPKLPDFNEVVEASFRPDNMRAVADWMSRHKLEPLAKVLGGKSAIATAGTEIENSLNQAFVVRQIQRQAARTFTDGVMAPLEARGNFGKIFGEIGDDGLIKSGSLAGKVPQHIVEHPEQYALSEAQKAWVREGHIINDNKLLFLRENGIKISELVFEEGGHYWGNRVFKFDAEGNVIDSAFIGAGPGRPGGKMSQEKLRVFDDVREAVAEGYRYLPPDVVLRLNVESAYRRVADKQMSDWLLARLPWRTAGVSDAVKIAAHDAKKRLQKIDKMDRLLSLAGRSSDLRPYEATMKSFETSFPELGQRFRLILPLAGQERSQAIRALKRDVRSEMSNVRRDFEKAYKVMAKEREIAIRPKYGEAAVYDVPAFQGKIFTGVESKKIAEAIRNEFDPKIIEALTSVNKVNALARYFVLAADQSISTIQLLFLAGYKPRIYGKAMKGFYEGLFNPDVIPQYLSKNLATIEKHPYLVMPAGGATEFTEALARGGILASKPMKGIRAPFEVFQRGYESGLTVAGIELAKSLDNLSPNIQKLMDVDGFINKFRGLINSRMLGVGSTQRQMESLSLLAAQYTRATFAILMDTARGGLRGDLARKAVGAGILGVMGAAVAFSLARGETTEEVIEHLSPSSPKFLTWRIAGQNIGPGTKVRSVLRLMGRWYEEPGQMGDSAMDFIRGNFSPIVGTATDLFVGEDVVGQKVRPENWEDLFVGDKIADGWLQLTRGVLGENLMPIWLQNIALGSGDMTARVTRGITEFIGFRASEASPAQMRNDRRKELAEAAGFGDWAVVPRLTQKRLEKTDEELKRWTEEAEKKLLESTGVEMALYRSFNTEITKTKERFAGKVSEITDIANAREARGDPDAWVKWRKSLQDEKKVLGADYERIYDDPQYMKMFEEWEEAGKQKLDDLKAKGLNEPIQNIAYDEYMKEIKLADLETAEGDYDFDERRRRENAFKAKWGDEIWRYVQALEREDKELPNEYWAYESAKEALELYWDLPRRVEKLVGLPEGTIERYEQARKQRTEEWAAAFRQRYPQIAEYQSKLRAAQTLLRKKEKAVEEALVKYYGYKSIELQDR